RTASSSSRRRALEALTSFLPAAEDEGGRLAGRGDLRSRQRHRHAWDPEAEDGARPGLDVLGRPDPPAVRVDDRPTDVEAETEATEAAAPGIPIGLVEALEHVLSVLGGNPD